jgi:hypothetical protein
VGGGTAALHAEDAVALDGHTDLVTCAEPEPVTEVGWKNESSTVIKACCPTSACHVGKYIRLPR